MWSLGCWSLGGESTELVRVIYGWGVLLMTNVVSVVSPYPESGSSSKAARNIAGQGIGKSQMRTFGPIPVHALLRL